MKKITLFTALCIFVTGIYAQKNQIPKMNSLLAKTSSQAYRTSIADYDGIQTKYKLPQNKSLESLGIIVGSTWYDLQTNKSVYNRTCKVNENTVAGIWTMSHTSSTAYADRGTGYNSFDGSSWQAPPTERLENTRTGFPSYTVAENQEIVVAHNGNGLTISTRAIGNEYWLVGSIPHSVNRTLSWPRIMSGGQNSPSLHLIACDYTGSAVNGLYYSRSNDGGLSWDIQDSLLPGLNPLTEMFPVGGDSYCMDVKGDTVGIVVGDMTTNVILIKSFDGGDTWEKQNIYMHPIPMWNTSLTNDSAGTSDVNSDGNPDTLTVTDGRYSMVIGNDGIFHVFMGITRIARSLSDAADFFTTWPYTDGLVYWNSTMNEIIPETYFDADTLLNKVGYMVDVNGNGFIDFNTVAQGDFPFGDFPFTSLSSMPSAAIDREGNIYCTYSSVVEGTDCGDGRSYRNIYAIKSLDNGNTWNEPVNITNDIYSECLFGSVYRNVDDNLYMTYQRSNDPGIAIQPSTDNPHIAQESDIMFVEVNNSLVAGMSDIQPQEISVSQNYPNPFSENTIITVSLMERSDLSLRICNMLGQEVYSTSKKLASPGSHDFNVSANNLESGIYYYTVMVGDYSITKKMMVQ